MNIMSMIRKNYVHYDIYMIYIYDKNY